MSRRKLIQTGDGTYLSYEQSGPTDGVNILLLPGWRQTAAQWRKQVDYFQTHYHITTFDYRGHGESEKPESEYTIRILASDVNDLMHSLELRNTAIVGHSMGCSVIWALWKYFPSCRDRIAAIVLADQSPCMLIDPSWTKKQQSDFGGVFTQTQLDQLDETFDTIVPGLIRSMFTDRISEQDLAWILSQNEKCSREIAIELLLNHVVQDWRDDLGSLDVPTLIIVAEASLFPVDIGAWLCRRIPDSDLVVFSKDGGGSHFMFWEAAQKFNSVVETFIRRVTSK